MSTPVVIRNWTGPKNCYNKSMSNLPATKKDIEDLSEMMQKMMNIVGPMSEDVAEIHLAVGQMDRKLDRTVDRVDDHSVRIKKLESKAA